MRTTGQLCWNCQGSGLIVVSIRNGYTVYQQCRTCRGAGYLGDRE